ncbi:MAG: ABC transporter substrate-binding protein, partial [Pseudomonadota bacterium]
SAEDARTNFGAKNARHREDSDMSNGLRIAKLALILGLALSSTPALAADKVVLGLDWQALGRHAGFFVAKADGYYQREGLDVDIQRGYGAADSIKRLAAGQSTFAFGDIGSLVLARAQGVPVEAVAVIYARSPYVLWVRKDANIQKPADLAGKRIGAPAGASVRALFPAFAAKVGLDDSKVKWVTVDAAGLYPLLFSKRADAVVDYEVGWPTISSRAAQAGIAIGAIKFSDYGFDIYSNAIMVTDQTAKANPDLVRRFVKASLDGMRAAFKDPAAAGQEMTKVFPILDPKSAAEEVKIVATLAETPDTRAHGLGYMSNDKMTLTRDIVAKAYDLKTDVPVDSLYSDQFLPK